MISRLRSAMFMLCGTIVACAVTCQAGAVDNTPTVVIRVDDCLVGTPINSWRREREALDNKSPYQYAKDHHIPMVWAAISSRPDQNGSLSWSEFASYLSECGGEVASHTHNHGNPSTDADAIYELIHSKQVIEDNLRQFIPDYVCSTFIQPGTWNVYNLNRFYKLSNAVYTVLQSTYDQSHAYLGSGWIIGDIPYRYGLACLTTFDRRCAWTTVATDTTLDIIANTPGVTAIFQLHEVEPESGTDDIATPELVYKEFIDKLDTLRNQGKIQIKSLREVYNRSMDTDLNHIVDSGFEKCVLGANASVGPWLPTGDVTIQPTGGYPDGLRYCRILGDGSWVKSGTTVLKPGRYEVTWDQKAETGYSIGAALRPYLNSMSPECAHPAIYYGSYYNSTPNVWEHKKALALITDNTPNANILFRPTSGGGFGVDNVSMIYAPLQQDISCTQTAVMASPGICTVRWRTPNDPNITSISVRYSLNTHPTSTSEGALLATIPAVPGSFQEMTEPFEWTGKIRVFFSVFAVQNGGLSAPPDIAIWIAPPAIQLNSLEVTGINSVHAAWTGIDTNTSIVDYEYRVGTAPGSDDVVRSIHTTSVSATLDGLPAVELLYFSVRTENAFGAWSSWASQAFSTNSDDISSACSKPNNTDVRISGVISAKFADCYYIQSADRARGIKVLGTTTSAEGDEITVTGVISLPPGSGERVITP